MAQKLIQEQTQKLVQQQRLSQQQMLFVKLLEMPLTELEEQVMSELDDNPALEVDTTDMGESDARESVLNGDDDREEDFEQQTEREERESALDEALGNIGRDDEMPETYAANNYQNEDYTEMVYGDSTSFYDELKEQVSDADLTETQHDILEYLIRSLDDDGLLRKDLDSISDELAIYHNIYADQAEIEEVLHLLQTFEPHGIGARSLQECLLIQIAFLPETKVRTWMESVIRDYYDLFVKKHWAVIQAALALSDENLATVKEQILKLNPKPGSSMGETQGRSIEQITPDFVVDVDDDGKISFYLNHGRMPDLVVSDSFVDLLDSLKKESGTKNKQTREAELYAKEKVENAQMFINAVQQRRHTLTITMKAIIDMQRKFFIDGDEADLTPMILKDIADRTGLDISTVSRVSNIKYVQTKWGVYPLKFFFNDGYVTEDGEELSTRKIKIILKEIIDGEDKKKPLNDDSLKDILKQKGYPIARRTVAKYREQLEIPIARLRKQ